MSDDIFSAAMVAVWTLICLTLGFAAGQSTVVTRTGPSECSRCLEHHEPSECRKGICAASFTYSHGGGEGERE